MRPYKLNHRPPLEAPRTPAPQVTPAAAERSGAQISADLAQDLLRILGQQFYLDRDKLFFQERKLLLQAITLPAKWLATKGGITTEIPAARYREIIMAVIQDVKRFGSMPDCRSPARYFWKTMQSHLEHNFERYYEEAKATRNLVEEVALGLQNRRRKLPAVDSTITDLTALHKLAKSPGGKRPAKPMHLACKPAAQPQPDLFQ